jgi:hypothetical protein
MSDAPESAGLPAPAQPAAEQRPAELPSIDRTVLERVLARAAQLQLAAGEETGMADGLSEAQLLDVGREVGLSPTHLRQALAEERTRVTVPEERGLIAQVAGAAMATAHRTVPGTPSEVLATLSQTMLRDESLTVKRRYADRVTWEPRRDFWAAFRRLAPSAGRTYDLLRANEVAATAVPVDAARTLVRLDADVSRTRAQRLQGGALVAAGGAGSGGLVLGGAILVHAFLLPALLVATVPVLAGLALGVGVARSHRQTVERAQLALEQVLDRLEHGEARRPGSFIDVLVR